MMDSNEDKLISAAAAEALGLRELTGGRYEEPDQDGHYQPVLWIDRIWIATVRSYYWYHVTLGVATIRTRWNAPEAEYRGFLFSHLHRVDTFLGVRPYTYFKLDNDEDQILELLHGYDLLPPMAEYPERKTHGNATFALQTFYPGGSAEIGFRALYFPVDEVSQRCWSVLLSLVPNFAKRTNDPATIALVENGPRDNER